MENGGMEPLGAPPQVPLDLKNGQNSGKLAKLLSFLPCRTLEVHWPISHSQLVWWKMCRWIMGIGILRGPLRGLLKPVVSKMAKKAKKWIMAYFSVLLDPRGKLTYQSIKSNVLRNLQVDNRGLGLQGAPFRIPRGSKMPKNSKRLPFFSASPQCNSALWVIAIKRFERCVDNRGLGHIGPLKSPHTQVILG